LAGITILINIVLVEVVVTLPLVLISFLEVAFNGGHVSKTLIGLLEKLLVYLSETVMLPIVVVVVLVNLVLV